MTKARRKRSRGRPRGPRTVRFPALLLPEQLETLALLSRELEGEPPVTGLIRLAVQAYIDAKLQDKALGDRIESQRRVGIMLVK